MMLNMRDGAEVSGARERKIETYELESGGILRCAVWKECREKKKKEKRESRGKKVGEMEMLVDVEKEGKTTSEMVGEILVGLEWGEEGESHCFSENG